MRTRALGARTSDDVAVELDGHPVLQIGLLEGPVAAGSIASTDANVAERVVRCSTMKALADRTVTVAARLREADADRRFLMRLHAPRNEQQGCQEKLAHVQW